MKTVEYGANQVQGQRYQPLDERSTRWQAVITGLAKAATPSRILVAGVHQGASALGSCGGAVNVLSADGNSLRNAAQADYPAPIVRLYRKCSVSATTPAADVLRSGEPLMPSKRPH